MDIPPLRTSKCAEHDTHDNEMTLFSTTVALE